MIWTIIGLLLSFAWIFLLFKIGQKKDNAFLFFLLLYAPVLIPLLIIGIINPGFFASLFAVLSTWAVIVLLAVIFERLAWGVTLREISGNDELVWFYIAYSIPLIGWLLYRVTKIR